MKGGEGEGVGMGGAGREGRAFYVSSSYSLYLLMNLLGACDSVRAVLLPIHLPSGLPGKR